MAWTIAVIIVTSVFYIWMLKLAFQRGQDMINKWVADNGYQLQSSRLCLFNRGPFFFRSCDSQLVYYVTVMIEPGRYRNAWIRCGGFMIGIFANKVTVKWD